MHELALSLLLSLAVAATPHGPTLAIEDTLHTELPPVLVSAPRVTLDEILDRVAAGEARRDSAMRDQACTVTMRMYRQGRHGEMELYEEGVWRVYKQRPDRVRSVLLRHQLGAGVKNEDIDLEFTPNMSERFVGFAFGPEARRDYRFHIAGRDLVGGHLLYRIAYEPRTSLDVQHPRGTVWVDTNEFVIVREEMGFEHSPVPLFVRRLDGMVMERARVDDQWVLKRMLVDVELTLPMPHVGRRAQFALMFDDYAINRGIDPAVFETRGRK